MFIDVMYFLFNPISRRAVAVGIGMADCGSFVEGRLQHLRVVEKKKEHYIFPVEKLKEPVVSINIGKKHSCQISKFC